VPEIGLKIFIGPAVMANMGVPVDKTGAYIEPSDIQNFCLFAACVRGVRTDVTDFSAKHSDFHPIKNFARVNIDKLPAGYDELGF
jgi:hypothetical protein